MAGLAPQPQDDDAIPEGWEAASPEEQALYERFVRRALAIVYPEQTDGEVSAEILANLRGDFDEQAANVFAGASPAVMKSPQDSLSATAVLVTMLTENALEQELGQQVPDEIVEHAGMAILEDLAEVQEAARIHSYDKDELEGAFYRALDLYRVASPRVDPEALIAGFEELKAADEAGTLNQVLPGLPGGKPMGRG